MAFNPARFIQRRSRRLGLDPRAVLSVARTEGGLVDRPGVEDIGDLSGGGSFGPFQLYVQGAFPQHLRGLSQQAKDDWAWSKAGIDYALNAIAGVAKGRRGSDAIENIVRRFERPADPSGQIRKALAYYRAGGKVPSNKEFGKSRVEPFVDGMPRRQELVQMIMANNASFASSGRTDPANTFNLLLAMRKMQDYGLDGGHNHGKDTGVRVSSKIMGDIKWADLGGPSAHRARALGNWQSDNAVDLGAPVGTPIYAPRGGRIVGGFGDASGAGGKIFGKRLTIRNKQGNEFFFTHMNKYARGIRPGARVRRGQVIGFVGAMPGGPSHLHFGVMRGDPYRFIR